MTLIVFEPSPASGGFTVPLLQKALRQNYPDIESLLAGMQSE